MTTPMLSTPVPQPKDKPKLLSKRDAVATLRARDEAERKKCKARSKGQCEVVEQWDMGGRGGRPHLIERRCARRISQNHHLIGGIGRRNKGLSILAEHRIDTCDKCHTEITGNVLKPASAADAAWADKVRYERVS